MILTRSTLLFVDASCLVAAAGSATGGSARVLAYIQAGFLRGAISPAVVSEAERNVRASFPPAAMLRFHDLLVSFSLSLVSLPIGWESPEFVRIAGGKTATSSPPRCGLAPLSS